MRPFGRTRAFATLSFLMLRIPIWLFASPQRRRRHEQAFFAGLSKGFGIHTVNHGKPSTKPGTLFVMNHVSWADIPVMLALLDADFVAKSDMKDWPVIGALARRFNPVFVSRTEQFKSHAQVSEIRKRLASGRSVILCPEGTTSDGTGILPFRTSLFAAADSASVVQAVVIRYLSPDGTALSPHRKREVAWIDDDDLLSGATRLAKSSTVAQVEFLPPVAAKIDRKELASLVRDQMRAAHAAAPKRLV